MIKKMAISYKIFEIPDKHASMDTLNIRPIVYLNKGNNSDIKILRPTKEITMQKKPQMIDNIFKEKNEYYKKINKDYRANQERIISDIICGIILQELRNKENKENKLLFFITSKFDTQKIVGRLGYLNLPTDRCIILFISRNISDFYTRNIISPFDSTYDITYLNKPEAANKIFGPYPDDGTIGLLRTFYKTYSIDYFPLRIDLFCQGLSSNKILQIKAEINNDYLSDKDTEPEIILGLKGTNKTCVPRILCDCEKYAEKMKEEIET
jgi:hypothetical protein